LPNVESKLKRQFAGLKFLHSDGGFDNNLKDGLRIGLGDLLDIHPAVT
jgi:hypothetical protein